MHLQTLFNIWFWNKIPDMSNIRNKLQYYTKLISICRMDQLSYLINKLFYKIMLISEIILGECIIFLSSPDIM